MTRFIRGPETTAAFEKSLFECMADLNKHVPGLSGRYGAPVTVSALAEHMGSALHVLLNRKYCDPLQVRFLLRSVEDFAFHNPQAPNPPPGPKPDSTH